MKMTRLLFVLALTCSLGGRASAQSVNDSIVEPSAVAAAGDSAAMPVESEATPAAAEAPAALAPLEHMAPQAEPAPEPAAPAPVEPAPAPMPVASAPAPLPVPLPNSAPALEGDAMEGEVGEDDAPARCALGEFCIGPVLSLGAINPLGIGVQARYGDYIGFGFDYQFLPTLTFSNASASWSLITVEARVYPFGGSFFLGGGFGYQTLNASATTGDPLGGSVTAEGSVGVPALKLGLGFMGRNGFVFGIDLGFNIPLGSTEVEFGGTAANAPPEVMADLRQKINDAADAGVNLAPFIPQLNLLRFGYLF
jgi:hypothetical protein